MFLTFLLLFSFKFSVTLVSVKHNGRGQSNNIRSIKQDTKDIRSGMLNLESQVKHFNGGMNDLTNYVKVNNFKGFFYKNKIFLFQIFLPDENSQHLRFLSLEKCRNGSTIPEG